MRRDDDLREEVQFHIDMRVERHIKDGLPPDEAAELARQQFGDVEAVMTDMRRARPGSKTALVAMASASVIVGLWIYTSSLANAPLVFPGVADVPHPMKFVRRPPPPPKGPTWEEFVAKVNTFGDGNVKGRRR